MKLSFIMPIPFWQACGPTYGSVKLFWNPTVPLLFMGISEKE